MIKKKVIIVGGGTAGAITASLFKKILGNKIDLKMIVDPDTPIIGVGESTTGKFKDYLEKIGISPFELIKELNCTFKLGIQFENWNSPDDGDVYWGLFDEYLESENLTSDELQLFTSNNLYHAYEILEDKVKLGNITYSTDHVRHNKIPFKKGSDGKLEEFGTYGIHIDATKFSNYLIDKLNIDVVKTKVTVLEHGENGISLLKTNDGDYTADLYIDCTGLGKSLIKNLGAEWESFTDWIPNNAAMFRQFPNNTKQYYNVTIASAGKYGWVWQVPLVERWGSGYVFNSTLNTKEEIVEDYKKIISRIDPTAESLTVDDFKFLSFDSGYLKNPWIKNCVSIGLSSGFIEPLESTNIHMIIEQAEYVIKNWPLDITEFGIQSYNEINKKMMLQAKEIVKAHYLSDRKDTEYWKLASKVPPELQIKVDKWRKHLVNKHEVYWDNNESTGPYIFGIPAWNYILTGMNISNKDCAKRRLDFLNLNIEQAEEIYSKLLEKKRDNFKKALSQTEVINALIS